MTRGDAGWTIGLIVGIVVIAQASTQCTSGVCANGVCKWGYTGYVCECNVGYQNLYGNQSVCVDYDECRVNTICRDGWCINYDGSYECKCNYGFQQTPDRKGCTSDVSVPFTNTHGFRDFLRSIGYKNVDKYLAPLPVVPQQHMPFPEIHAPQNHAYPQPYGVNQNPNQYNPPPNTVHYQQPSPGQYDPQHNPSQYNPRTFPIHQNPQTSTTTPVPADVEPTEAPPEIHAPTQNAHSSLENQIIDQNLQMMWEDPYGPKRPVFLDQTAAEINTPKSQPLPSNQVYHPSAPTLPESHAPQPFPSHVTSYGHQAAGFQASQNQGSWVETLGPQRPAFLDQPITRPPHQVHDPSGQFQGQVPRMSVEQGLAPNAAMGYPASVPNQHHVLWNSNPPQQFPVMNVPTHNAGTPFKANPGAQQMSSMSLSPEYNQSPNNPPLRYSHSLPPLDFSNASPPQDLKMDLQSITMASSEVPIISHHATHYQGPFADPRMHSNPYHYPGNKFAPGHSEWQQPYPSYPLYDPHKQGPYTDVVADGSNRLQTDSQVVPSEGIPSIGGETPANEPPPSATTSSPTSETITTNTAVTPVFLKATEAAAESTTLVADATTTTTTSAPDTTRTPASTRTTTTVIPSTTASLTTSTVATSTTTTPTAKTSVEPASTWVKQTGQNVKISVGVDLSGTPSQDAPAASPAASFKIQAEGVPNDIASVPNAPLADATTVTPTTKVTTARTVSPSTSTKTPAYTRTTRKPIVVPMVAASNDRFDINSQVTNIPVRPQSPNIIPNQYIMKIPPKDRPRQMSVPNQQTRPKSSPRQQPRPSYPARRPIVPDTKSPQRAPQAQVIQQVENPPNVQYPVKTQKQTQMKSIPHQLYPTPKQYPVTTGKQYVLQNRPGQLSGQYPPIEQHSSISRLPFRGPEQQRQRTLNVPQNFLQYQKKHSTISRVPVHQKWQHPLIVPQNQPNYPYVAPNASPQFSSRGMGTWTNTAGRQMYNVRPSGSSVQSPQRLSLARPTTSTHSSWINAGTSEQGNSYDSFSNSDVLMTLLISQLLN